MLVSNSGRRPLLTRRRIVAFLTLAMVAALAASYSTSSASLERDRTSTGGVEVGVVNPMAALVAPGRLGRFGPTFMPQALPAESIATYAVDCTTPKTSFALGETVCAVTTNAPVDSPALRSLTWQDPAGFVVQRTDLTAMPPSDSLALPTDPQSLVFGFVVDNVGSWRVNLVPASSSRVRAAAFFTVRDPANASADLNIYNSAVTPDGQVPAGSNLTVQTSVANFGPDDAVDVVLTEAVPANATFVSETQTDGLAFTCTDPASGGGGTSNCTIANLPVGAQAVFTFVYEINAGAPKNTLLASLAHVSSATAPLNTADDSWTAKALVTENPNAPTCAVGCPANITVTASSSSGRVVNFAGDIEVSGSCGTVTATPASGSLFPVGTTTVNVSSTQGASCSFTVTVLTTAAPTITCAADQTAQASGAQNETSVAINTPSAAGTNVIITGVRNDNRGVSDPYPVGNTTITWTAQECLDPIGDPDNGVPPCSDPFARSASCTQHIIVTSADAPTISCPSDKTFNASSGCATTLTATQIGTPTATGTNVVVTSERSDHLPLTDPFPAGQTTITWTAKECLDPIGDPPNVPPCSDPDNRSVSCTQIITITTTGGDTTPPTFVDTPEAPFPPDLNVTTTTCSALLDDELGVATATDNCSTVNITRTGVPLTACTPPNVCPIPCPIAGNPGRTCVENFIFQAGTTDVTYTATDAAGNHTTGVQHVTVHESSPPTFTFVPADLPLHTGPGASSCDTFVGDATLGTATVADNCDTTVIRSGVPAGNIFPVGQTTITYTAKADTSVTATQIVTVVDNTPPTITAPADSSAFADANCLAPVPDYRPGTTAADNCGSVTLTQSPAAGTLVGYGPHNVVVTAADGHGNSNSDTVVFTVNDNTPPVITCPANIPAYLPLNSTATSMAVSYPNATATDNCGQPITLAYSKASGSDFNVGPTIVTATATDSHGNTASCTFTVTVLYNFTGFFSPISNLPTLNVVNAGRAIPVKFSLSGNKGLNIFAANSPYTVGITCDGTAPSADVTETVTAGGSSLSYSPDQYNYVWKTENSWVGTCRQLVVTLNDGSVHRANFKFR